MKFPLLLIVVAGLAASVVAYGTYPIWMQYPRGLDVILWSRRLQWLLASVSLIACVLLISLAISGRRRAWWLIGLAPVLALFAHRFSTGPAAQRMMVLEHPQFVSADQAKIDEDAWVVGLKFGDQYFAYPYSMLFAAPVVIQDDHDKRMILMWSAFANRALAMTVSHELRARDLDVVSTPANALLIYDSRHGQFINGITGQTPLQQRPAGFADELPTIPEKMTWRNWKALHPQSQILAGLAGTGPSQPIQPIWPMPRLKLALPAETRVAVVGHFHPILLTSDPLVEGVENTSVDDLPIVIIRDRDQSIRVFSRRILDENRQPISVQLAVNDAIIPAVPPRRNSRHRPKGAFIDINSNTGWNADGVCVDAQSADFMKGKRLKPIPVDVGLPLGVMKFWYPDLAPPEVVVTKVDAQELVEKPPVKPRH